MEPVMDLEKSLKNEIYARYRNAAMFEGKNISKERLIADTELIYDRLKSAHGLTWLNQEHLIEQVFGKFEKGIYDNAKLCPKTIIAAFQNRRKSELESEHRQSKNDKTSIYDPMNGIKGETLRILYTDVPEALSDRSRQCLGHYEKAPNNVRRFIYDFETTSTGKKHCKGSFFLQCVEVYRKRRSLSDLLNFLETLPEVIAQTA